MEKYICKPDITMYPGLKVEKNTELEFKNDNVVQSIKDLVLKSKTTIKGENFKSVYNTEIKLNEGDVLIFEEDGRGYVKPVEEFMTVDEIINELNCLK
jgi:hypothetical protein